MDWFDYISIASYVLMGASYLMRDIIWLRGLSIFASGFDAVAAWGTSNRQMTWGLQVAMDILFITTNLIYIFVILRAQWKVRQLSQDMKMVHKTQFPSLSAHEFHKLAKITKSVEWLPGEKLTRAGIRPEAIYLIVDGEVLVTRDSMPIVLGCGKLVGEMSFIKDRPAFATVVAIKPTRTLAFDQAKLAALIKKNEVIRSAVYGVFTHDVLGKMPSVDAA